jgi:hypothetical protein
LWRQSIGFFLFFMGVDVSEEPPELAIVGARPLEVQQVAGLRDAMELAVLAQLPVNEPSGFSEFIRIYLVSTELNCV